MSSVEEPDDNAANLAEQEEELSTLEAIYGDEDGVFSYSLGSGTSPTFGRILVTLVPESDTINVAIPTGSSLIVSQLPPVSLLFSLPQRYPSYRLPKFTLSATWLGIDQIAILRRKLDRFCSETLSIGSMVLFDVASMISSEGLAPLLSSENTLILQSAEALDAVIAFDKEMEQRKFDTSSISCGICLDTKSGAASFRFTSCSHTYCKACLLEYFSIHIHEKQAAQVTCPSPSCKKEADTEKPQPLPPQSLAAILPPELLRKYEELLHLHNMLQQPNLTYCPRTTCQAPTLKDPEEEKLCICPSCKYAFCFFCNRTWHGYASYCQIRHLTLVAEEYKTADDQHKRTMETKYGKKTLERAIRELEEDAQNAAWLSANAQACPHCRVMVQRSEGCAHMTCKTCGTHFCFLCGERLRKEDPYKHFNTRASPCYGKLFEGALNEAPDPFEFEEEEDAGAGAGGARLPPDVAGNNPVVLDGAGLAPANADTEAVEDRLAGIVFDHDAADEDFIVDEFGFVTRERWR
ncbi:RWD domain-containing protein [Chytriomyces sp. MP71]|nr:RWD domain-containing protein [Chytriomyces sp. MP71]